MPFPCVLFLRKIYRKWRHIDVVYLKLRQFVKLLDRAFLSKAKTDREIEKIIDIVNSGGLLGG